MNAGRRDTTQACNKPLPVELSSSLIYFRQIETSSSNKQYCHRLKEYRSKGKLGLKGVSTEYICSWPLLALSLTPH